MAKATSRKSRQKAKEFLGAISSKKHVPILFALFFLNGCGIGGPAYAPPVKHVAATINMGFSSYSPETVTIRSGETIEWRNTSLLTHTVTDDKKQAKKFGDAVLPQGAAVFDSGDIAAGKTYLHTFSVPGTYHYSCDHHEEHGMVGTVIVSR